MRGQLGSTRGSGWDYFYSSTLSHVSALYSVLSNQFLTVCLFLMWPYLMFYVIYAPATHVAAISQHYYLLALPIAAFAFSLIHGLTACFWYCLDSVQNSEDSSILPGFRGYRAWFWISGLPSFGLSLAFFIVSRFASPFNKLQTIESLLWIYLAFVLCFVPTTNLFFQRRRVKLRGQNTPP